MNQSKNELKIAAEVIEAIVSVLVGVIKIAGLIMQQ